MTKWMVFMGQVALDAAIAVIAGHDYLRTHDQWSLFFLGAATGLFCKNCERLWDGAR